MRSWTVTDFQIQEQLGRGKFGIVYRAKEKNSAVIVALKMIAKIHVNTENMQRQLRRQIEIHTRLKHKHICEMYGYFQDQHHLFLVMEYCPEGMLFTKVMINREFLSEQQISKIVYQLLTAICYMSVRSVIHRDLKLENVMVKDGDVKIIDFGWCVHTFRRRNTFCGTTEYLSPEMLNGGEYDSRLDVYTLGIMMYEMLYQRSPFYQDNELDILRNIREGVLLFFDDKRSASDEAKQIVSQMLINNHELRPRPLDLINHPFFIKYRESNQQE